MCYIVLLCVIQQPRLTNFFKILNLALCASEDGISKLKEALIQLKRIALSRPRALRNEEHEILDISLLSNSHLLTGSRTLL